MTDTKPSDTPRTDAVFGGNCSWNEQAVRNWSTTAAYFIDLCRELERELTRIQSAEMPEPVAWMNPLNGVVISAKQKGQIGEGRGYPRFSTPLYGPEVLAVIQRKDAEADGQFQYAGRLLEQLHELEQEKAALIAENEGLRKNDARYRWLRDTPSPYLFVIQQTPDEGGHVEEYTMQNHHLDAAIDNAMKGGGE